MEDTASLDKNEPAVVLDQDTLIDQAISLGLWGIGGTWLMGMLLPMTVLHRFFSAEQLEGMSRLYTRGQILLTGSRLRHVVHPGIAHNRPYMFFQNHINHLDHCTMYNATPHIKQGLELEAHFKYPIYGEFMRRRGTIPVKRGGSGNPELVQHMGRELQAGNSLLVFPEGTRTLTGRLGDFRSGVFRIAQQLGASIVPVTVTGMYRVMRKGSLMIRPGHEVTVYCDAPIEASEYAEDELPALMARVHGVMRGRLDDYWAARPPQARLR